MLIARPGETSAWIIASLLILQLLAPTARAGSVLAEDECSDRDECGVGFFCQILIESSNPCLPNYSIEDDFPCLLDQDCSSGFCAPSDYSKGLAACANLGVSGCGGGGTYYCTRVGPPGPSAAADPNTGKLLIDGVTCKTDDECANYCVDSSCTADPDRPASVSLVDGEACSANTDCVNLCQGGVCSPGPVLCETDDDCDGSPCIDEFCSVAAAPTPPSPDDTVALLEDGEACGSDDECENFCNDGVCGSATADSPESSDDVPANAPPAPRSSRDSTASSPPLQDQAAAALAVPAAAYCLLVAGLLC